MKRVIVAVVSMALFWFMAWLAGYDFDQRNEAVASWFFFSTILSLLASTFPDNK
jgi:hypothetical protein